MDAGELSMADLVVEILSPSSAMYDRTAKADTYAALGVRKLWLVDVERQSIEQRVLVEGTWEVRGVFSDTDSVRAETFRELVVVPADVYPS